MFLLANQNLVYQGPQEPTYFEQNSLLWLWISLIIIICVITLIIWLINKKSSQTSTTISINQARDLHSWDNLITHWELATQTSPYSLELITALFKQASYLIYTNKNPTQKSLNLWLNLTPQELTQEITQTKNIQNFDSKNYLQKLNYLEHIRFNPQWATLPQEQLLKPTLEECLTLLQSASNHMTSQEQNA